eukprot:Rmarinus@m.3984
MASSVMCSDLSFSAGQAGGPLYQMLSNVTTLFKANEFCAIMGPSGAGKSTLLNILAGRASGGILEGSVYINGHVSSARSHCAYVMQDPALFEMLTVYETLKFSAKLRMNLSDEKIDARVNEVVELLRLRSCLHTRVGSPDNPGLSGGEKQRLSIGTEILVLPQVVFLDEPTTGLDSEMAQEVVHACRAIADTGRVVVSTIHQPSAEVFHTFDKLLLLSFGEVLYFGPPKDCVEILEGKEVMFARGIRTNDADYVLAGASDTDRAAKKLRRVYEASTAHEKQLADIEDIRKGSTKHSPDAVVEDQVPPSLILLTLMHRFLLVIRRERVTRLVFARIVLLGLLAGSLFWEYDQTIEGSKVLLGACFAVMFVNINLYSNTMAQMFQYRNVIEREVASSCYTPVFYQSSFMVTQFPTLLVQSLLYTVVAYPMFGFDGEAERVVYFYLVVVFLMYIGLIVTMALSVMTRSLTWAFAQVTQLLLLYCLFSGFLILPSEMWIGLRWVSTIIISRWALAGLIVNEVSGKDLWCYEDEPTTCMTEDELLDYFGCEGWNKWNTFLVFLAWGVCVNVLVTWLMYRTKDEKLNYSQVALGPKKKGSFADSDVETPRMPINTAFDSMKSLLVKARQSWKSFSDGEGSEETKSPYSKGNANVPRVRVSGVDAGARPSAPRSSAAADSDTSARQVELSAEKSPLIEHNTVRKENYKSVSSSPAVVPSDLAGGIEVLFRNVTYCAWGDDGENTKELIHNVSGVVTSGETCALMGPSGAGKTTLLKILAGKSLLVPHGSGEVYLNGTEVGKMDPAEHKSLQALRAYVPQEDFHLDELTVKETLQFSAIFRLPPSAGGTIAQREERVRAILSILNLHHVRHMKVMRISGGERRRLSIGVEVIAFPPLIFLDEATSGLDATMALEVVSALRTLADQQKTVLFTIHQPSHAAFLKFDKLLLLAGGETVYFGPALEAFDFMHAPPLSIRRENLENPADVLMIAAQGHALSTAGDHVPVGKIITAFTQTPEWAKVQRYMDEEEEVYRAHGVKPLPPADFTRLPKSTRFGALTVRVLLHLWRSGFLHVLVGKHIATGLIIGLLYYDRGTNYEDAESRAGCLYLMILFAFMTFMQTIPRVVDGRVMMYREESAGGYSRMMYAGAETLAALPWQMILSLFFSFLLWQLVDLREGTDHFFYLTLMIFLAEQFGFMMCLLLGSACPTHQVALTVFLVPTTFLSLLSGYSPRSDSVPRGWRPFFAINPAYWAMKGVFRNEFENTGTWYEEDTGRTWTDDEVLEEWGADDWEKMNSVLIMFVCVLSFFVAAIVVVHRVDFSQRKP